ncbi:PqqD family protein [Streptomyces sp. DSM 110735]|uniref:PqqD family protein n=1 Tax=Streptomyces sp. DSM 110735 TaxID=2775031 RepID=UPI0018F4471D|nr:PqqD family protein [Streptomyces sp. DSM 110735]MBJ7901752.1 PqqD family protein [Streptomyces sp. DSM 110735]
MSTSLRVPRRALGVRVRRVAGDLVIGIDADALELTDVAKLIYESADGLNRVADIVGIVAAAYDADPAEVSADVSEFLDDLVGRGVVEWVVEGPLG